MEEMKQKREKVKQAVALSYDPEEDAPKVIASGRGALAERIIERAKEANVAVHRDDKLADTLSRLEIGDMIPPELYEVVAEILVPSAMSCRYYGSPQFVLGSDTFIKDTGTKDVMHMMFDMKNNQSARAMESFLKNYTEQVEPLYSYESKFSYEKEFDSFRGMFLLLGGVLSGVIAVVGTLNFLNAILTGMIARRREFAVLQSVGMTRRQLKRMLVYEGLLYTFAAIVISLILVVASEPFMGKMIEKMFWFFRFQYTIGPVVLAALIFTVIGAGVPLVVYRVVGKQTIVERLRETE